MSTVKQPLKYLWTAYFDDGKIINQPVDDRYSKHDATAEWNPTAFRDMQDYCKKAKLIYFDINDGTFAYGIDLPSRRFGINGTWFQLPENEPLEDIRVEFWRGVQKETVVRREKNEDGTINQIVEEGDPYIADYNLGYSGKNIKGKRILHTIRVI